MVLGQYGSFNAYELYRRIGLTNKPKVCIYIAYCMHPISHHKDTGADGDVTANHRRHDNGSDSECISDHNTYKSDGKEWRVF